MFSNKVLLIINSTISQCYRPKVRQITIDYLLQELSLFDSKDKEIYQDKRRIHRKSLIYDLFLIFEKRLIRYKQLSICQIMYNYRACLCAFLLGDTPNPIFCVPSQFVSWSAQPLEPPSETYVSALHDM